LNSQYEVLSPWAEADPKPLRGISPRLKDLTGKRIGLFVNRKRASQGIMNTVEAKLKERYPTATFSYFSYGPRGEAAYTEVKAEFKKWVSESDAVVLGVGD
jgi:hypothetical protein